MILCCIEKDGKVVLEYGLHVSVPRLLSAYWDRDRSLTTIAYTERKCIDLIGARGMILSTRKFENEEFIDPAGAFDPHCLRCGRSVRGRAAESDQSVGLRQMTATKPFRKGEIWVERPGALAPPHYQIIIKATFLWWVVYEYVQHPNIKKGDVHMMRKQVIRSSYYPCGRFSK